MRIHLTRRTALKTLFCGAACFRMPDLLVKRRIFSAYAALAPSQEYNPGYELGQKICVPIRITIRSERRPHGRGYCAWESSRPIPMISMTSSIYWMEFGLTTMWLMTT